MAEKPRDAGRKANEEPPKIKRAPEPKTKTESPEAIQKDVVVEDRFQSTDN